MLRVLLALAWLAVTVYALADWFRTPEDQMPARLPRLLWLLLILITIPSFSIGSIAWIVLRAVQRAEAERGGESVPGPVFGGLGFPSFGGASTPDDRGRSSAQTPPVAPDDDPDFLFKLQRDIQRQRSHDSRSSGVGDERPADGGSNDRDSDGQTGAGEDPKDEDSGPLYR